MKVRPSVKPICDKCKVIKREGKVMVICSKSKKTQTSSRLKKTVVKAADYFL